MIDHFVLKPSVHTSTEEMVFKFDEVLGMQGIDPHDVINIIYRQDSLSWTVLFETDHYRDMPREIDVLAEHQTHFKGE